MRIEPAQQPGVDVRCLHAAHADTGIGQPSQQAITHCRQRVLWGLPSTPDSARRTAVDHQAHAAALAAPGQSGHGGVLEKPAGFGDGAQVMSQKTLITFTEGAALGAGLDVVAQGVQVAGPVGFVLGVELHHPGVFVQLIEAVLQGVFQGVTSLQQPLRFPPLGADRRQLEEGCD